MSNLCHLQFHSLLAPLAWLRRGAVWGRGGHYWQDGDHAPRPLHGVRVHQGFWKWWLKMFLKWKNDKLKGYLCLGFLEWLACPLVSTLYPSSWASRALAVALEYSWDGWDKKILSGSSQFLSNWWIQKMAQVIIWRNKDIGLNSIVDWKNPICAFL